MVHDTNVNSIININTNLKRVGINKPAPGYPLVVAGDMNISLNYTINGTHVLSSNLLIMPTISNVLNMYTSNITASTLYTPMLSNFLNIYTINITASNIYTLIFSNILNVYSRNVTANNLYAPILSNNVYLYSSNIINWISCTSIFNSNIGI
jgi:hypothetical protein